MEPLFEIADRITAHVWFLHEMSQMQHDTAALLSTTLTEARRKSIAEDYGRLAAVRDLADVSCPDDANPADPLPHVRKQNQATVPFWNVFKARSARVKADLDRRDKEANRRELAAEEAFRVLEKRSKSLLRAGLQNRLSLQAAPESNGPLPSTRLLTSDELFERVLEWLCSLSLDEQISLATEFLPLDGPNPNCNPSGANLQADSHPSWLDKQISKLARPRIRTRFLLEQSIDLRARSIEKSGEYTTFQREEAQKWLAQSENERLRVLLSRQELRRTCRELDVPVPFSIVLSDELDEIQKSRRLRLPDEYSEAGAFIDDASHTPEPCSPMKRAFQSNLFGLALSGGGIRSATFNLGLLQGMADRNVLPLIDIISTVSGGGYIASWLIAWTKRRGHISSVQDSLKGYASSDECSRRRESQKKQQSFSFLSRNQDPHADHLRPVRLLREYARYLAPQAGLFSADTWTIFTTWLRNTILNLMILLLFFGVLLLLPRMVGFTLIHLKFLLDRVGNAHSWWQLLIAGSPFLFTCWIIGRKNLRFLRIQSNDPHEVSRGYDDSEVVLRIILLLLLEGLLYVAVLWNLLPLHQNLALAVSPFLVITAAGIVVLHITSGPNYSQSKGSFWVPTLIFWGTIGTAYVALWGFAYIIARFQMNTLRGIWLTAAVGPILFMMVLGATILAFQGLCGTVLSDGHREWWSRLGAWLLISITAWLIIATICFFMPLWIAMAGIKIAGAGIAWGSLTAAGVKLAFSGKRSGKDEGDSQHFLTTLVLSVAPSVFVVGLLSFTSYLLFWGNNLFIDFLLIHSFGLHRLVDDRFAHKLCCTNLPLSFERMVTYYWPLMNAGSFAPLLLALLLFLTCWFLAWRVDINEFSMHHFYRNRLVRAYLGASRSRAHRLPNAFTGFDPEDDIPLKRFMINDPSGVRDMVGDCRASYIGPFPIISTALNITKGQDLGIQERRAEAFFFSPLWSGFDFARKQTKVRQTCMLEFGFRRTDQFGSTEAGDGGVCGENGPLPVKKGVSLGTAMAISGAAFNSNAGFHTSPPLAFLLTVFGVRLGWWAGNPRSDKWNTDSPAFGLEWLLRELTANSGTDGDYVLLTDGGHFENMGLYELVRRRCRFVIISDAEEDEKFKLEGIGGAIRKCRDDFGVVITLDLEALEPVGNPTRSTLHYSVGTIRYPGERDCGSIIYIKSSLTNDEAIDLVEFGKRHPEFPHTSTANQFFDESHFESYRELGHHIASIVFQTDERRVKNIFDAVQGNWAEAMKRAQNRRKANHEMPAAEDLRNGEQP